MGQSSSSLVLSAIKTEVPSDCDDPAIQDLLLQLYGERIERLSQQDKLSKFCMDAGFLSVDENGQYFMTKDTGALTQSNTVACREYTLPREDSTSQPKGWIQGTTQHWARVRSCNQLFARYIWSWYQNLVFEQTIIAIKWEFLMDQISFWWIWRTKKQKFQKISSKNMH